MLTRIDFENFRGFRSLSLDGLQRVNLVVGRNNSGKTSLLEGVAVLVNPARATEQFSQLRQLERELAGRFARGHYADWLLHDEADSASLSGRWSGRSRDVSLVTRPDQPDTVIPQSFDSQSESNATGPRVGPEDAISTCVVSSRQRHPEDLVQSLGQAIRRRDGEELLETALKAVDVRIKKVRIVPIQHTTQVVVDIGLSRLVPISQVGQGTYRLVEIFSEVIGADARVAFIDEIENGIHHTCLVDVWKGIAEAADRFDVQVFATTHSHECIEAAHAAFTGRPQYDFGIIQLFRESGEIQGRVLDRNHIEAAMAGDIDLRA